MNSQHHLKTLKNGLKVLTIPMPQTKSVTALVLVKTGSRNERKEEAGLSHFLEHMVFKGTKKYPNALKLASTVDGVGAEFNAFTSKEYTGFYVKSSSNNLDLSLEVLHELVFNSLLPEKEIEKEKGVICEEINMYEDQPISKIGEEFEILLYGLTPLGRPVIGFKKTVSGMKKKNFLDYLERKYYPENMLLCLAGSVGNLSKVLADWEKVENYSLQGSSFREGSTLPRVQPSKTRVIYKKTEQAHFCLGVPAFKRGHQDRYVLAVLATILGGNMSSRLFMEVREKRGLAYYVKTSVQDFQDAGFLVTQAGVDIKKIDMAVEVIKREYQKVQSSKFKVQSEEIKRGKEFLKGHLVLSLEDSKNVASFYAEDLLFEGKIRTPEEIIEGVEKVKEEDLRRVAKEIFRRGLYLAVIGPYKDGQRFKKLVV